MKGEHTFFLPYQRRWLEDRGRLRLMEKSRQIGMSLTAAFDLVRKTSRAGNAYDAWVTSRDDLQAQLFGMDCAKWARIGRLRSQELQEQVVDEKEGVSAHVLPFHNGRAIYSLSSNPDAQAGKRGRRVFDEFALNGENRKLYTIGQPGTLWGGGLDIISTHRGSGNFFNELVREAREKGNPKGFSVHRVTMVDAVREGLLVKLKEKWGAAEAGDERLKWTEDDFLGSLRKECADEEAWRQEFMCEPGDDEAAFLSYDLMAGCEYGAEERWEYWPAGELYAGVDLGRTEDWTVIWVGERLGEVGYTRQVICLRGAGFEEQERVLYEVLERPNFRRCCIDQTGMGRQFAERATRRFGKGRVEGVQFTARVKEEMAYGVKAGLEKRTIRIPNDRRVRADLRSLRRSRTAAGNLRLEAERTREGHGDRFWAMALWVEAMKVAGEQRFYAEVI